MQKAAVDADRGCVWHVIQKQHLQSRRYNVALLFRLNFLQVWTWYFICHLWLLWCSRVSNDALQAYSSLQMGQRTVAAVPVAFMKKRGENGTSGPGKEFVQRHSIQRTSGFSTMCDRCTELAFHGCIRIDHMRSSEIRWSKLYVWRLQKFFTATRKSLMCPVNLDLKKG